jgi:hypothetical protein
VDGLDQRQNALCRQLQQPGERLPLLLKERLQNSLDASRDEIIAYYIQGVLAKPPDKFRGQLLNDATE